MAGSSKPADAVSPEVVKEHQEGWSGFTRFMTISIVCVLIILLAFLLQFGTGWGFAAFFMILGFLTVGVLMLIGKL